MSMKEPVFYVEEDHEEGKSALTGSENDGDCVPGERPQVHSECSPPAGGPDAESIKFLDEDDVGVEEDLETEEDCQQADEIMSQEELEHAGGILLNKMLNQMTPGGDGVVNKSKTNLGTGSLFGRPTPAQLLLAANQGRPKEDSDSSDDDDVCAWNASTGMYAMRSKKAKEVQGGDIQLGSVCFYDRASSKRSASVPLITCMPSLNPFVQVASEQRIPFRQWLSMARTNTELLPDDGRVVPGATSSSLL